MTILGFSINAINAFIDVKKSYSGTINVNSVPSIEKLEEKKLPNTKDIVEVTFSFKSSYEPKIGEVEIKGTVLYHEDDIKKVLSDWKNNKKLNEKMAVEVLNTIFRKCLSESVGLADKIGLPPPLRFPEVKPGKKDGNDYTG